MSKGIFVVMEQRYGKVQNVGLELVGEATRLKEDLKDDVVAVLLGHNVEGEVAKIFHYGADKVILVDNPILENFATEPYTKAITEVIKAFDPEIMLFGASSIGRDVAPRVASRVKTGLVADTTGLRMAKTEAELAKEAEMGNKEPERALLMTRPAFGGNIMATLMCPRTKPQMATVRPGVMKMIAKDEARVGELVKFDVNFTDADMNIEILEVVKSEHAHVDLTEAKLIVSGGRGVGSAAGFDVINDVADALGADTQTEFFRFGMDSAVFTVRSQNIARTHQSYPARVGETFAQDFAVGIKLFDADIARPCLFGCAFEVHFKFCCLTGKLSRNIYRAGDKIVGISSAF